jgi:hypothetical protein
MSTYGGPEIREPMHDKADPNVNPYRMDFPAIPSTTESSTKKTSLPTAGSSAPAADVLSPFDDRVAERSTARAPSVKSFQSHRTQASVGKFHEEL